MICIIEAQLWGLRENFNRTLGPSLCREFWTMFGNVNRELPVYGKVGIRNYSGPLSEASIGAL